jgi:MFS family permease
MKPIRTFYILIVTQIFSLIGSRMTGIAIGIKVFNDTGDTAPLLIAAFFAELPGMLGNSLTGWLADRIDRRRAIMLGDIGQATATGLLMLSFLTGSFQLWHLYAMMLFTGIFAAVQGPASQAAMTMLVPENLRDRANGIREIGFPLAGVIAPAAAALLYNVIGVVGVMLIDLATFAVAVTVITLIHIPRPAQSDEARESGGVWWREALGGWRFMVKRPALIGTAIYISFIWFLINGPLATETPYLLSITGSEAMLGVLLSVKNLGAFAGAATVAAVGKVRQRMLLILGGMLLLGVMMMIYGVARHPILLGITLFGMFYPLPAIGALFATLLQNKTPPDMQGRVFGAYGQMGMLLTPFSFLITAALVDNVLEPAVQTPGWAVVAPLVGDQPGAGIGLMLVIVGGIIVVISLLVGLHPRVRHLETDLPDYVAESDLVVESSTTVSTTL